jgi:hypothetical protein
LASCAAHGAVVPSGNWASIWPPRPSVLTTAGTLLLSVLLT